MSPSLGEFEQMVLLAILQRGEEAFALQVLEELDQRAGRRVSRGALYKTLERLEAKKLIGWAVEDPTPGRGGHPRRIFHVTRDGIAILRASRDALHRMWRGLDGILGVPNP